VSEASSVGSSWNDASSNERASNEAAADPRPRLDHLVLGVPDLESGVRQVEALLGVAATPGGAHPGLGTRNALVSVGADAYLEIIGPDPGQAPPERGRPFGIDGLRAPRLVTWAVRVNDPAAWAARCTSLGIHLGAVASMSRRRPDGVLLTWRLTDVRADRAGGILPFLIDWGDSPHPAASLPRGCGVVRLRAVHPDPPSVAGALHALGIDLPVARAAEPGLAALVECPVGRIELR
jgi:hypothetical protein